MAKKVKSLSQLQKYIQKDVNDILEKEIAPRMEWLLKEHIQKDVYDVYSPNMYDRRGKNGGLLDPANIKSNVYDGLLEIYDDALAFPYYYKRGKRRKSKNAGQPLSNIIESGVGYDITDWDYYGEPRPFMHNTYDDLVEMGEPSHLIKRALQILKGYEVK